MKESVQLSVQLIDNKIQRIRSSQNEIDSKIAKLQNLKSNLSENILRLEKEKQKLQNSKQKNTTGSQTEGSENAKRNISAMDVIRTMSGS